jgi:hypothetical protein
MAYESRKEVNMKTHRTLVCLALAGIAALAPSLFSAEKVIQSQWAAVPVRVDGTNQEWQDAAMIVEKVSEAEYALRNDDKYLYILFVFKSIPALSTFEMSGMKVYYSFDSKKNKSDGFHFIKKTITGDQLIANLEKNGEVLTDEKKAGIRQQKAYMVYEGMPLDPLKPAPPVAAGPADPPTFRDKLSQKLSVVEFRIPLARLVQAGGAVAAPGSSLKLGFEWGGMTAEMRSAYMARMGDSGSRAGAQGGGEFDPQGGEREEGGGTGGPMGGRPDPRTKKHSFWVDVQLAAKVS